MSIDPRKATPQAPRQLRVGSKGHARALAAKFAGKAPPDKDDDDDDDAEDSDYGDAPKPGPGEADTDGMAAASEACRTASEACGRAQEQLDATSAELDGGTDSISTLQATEAACDEAIEELQEAKARCMALRGAEAEEPVPDGAPPAEPPPPADQARALAAAAPARTAEAHLETGRLAAFGAYVLKRLGLTAADTVKAKGVLGGKLDLAAQTATAKKSEQKTKAEADTAKREKLWEWGVRTRRVQMAQAFARADGPPDADGKPTAVRVYAEYATKQNAAYPELEAFEAWIQSRVPEPGTQTAEPSTALADLAAEKQRAFALTERDRLEAKRAGVDPDVLAQQLAMQQKGGARGAGERA